MFNSFNGSFQCDGEQFDIFVKEGELLELSVNGKTTLLGQEGLDKLSKLNLSKVGLDTLIVKGGKQYERTMYGIIPMDSFGDGPEDAVAQFVRLSVEGENVSAKLV